jgi:hypothetical protein
MSSSASLKLHIEGSLAHRFPAVLSPAARTIHETAPTGIPAVDSLLQGGIPVGAITEIIGHPSSGRTSLALTFLAQLTASQRLCAWVDLHDSLDPEAAAAAGIALARLLWVRCSDHPANGRVASARRQHWDRLDQALRATDLLLQVGGFGALVLDLASAAPEYTSRIPAATWFRFRQAADRTRCSLLVLTQPAVSQSTGAPTSCTQSSAALLLDCDSTTSPTPTATLLASPQFRVSRRRERFAPASNGLRKPPTSTWQASPAWDSERRA